MLLYRNSPIETGLSVDTNHKNNNESMTVSHHISAMPAFISTGFGQFRPMIGLGHDPIPVGFTAFCK